MNDSLISFRGITKDYRMGEVTVHALRGLDLDVPRGEFSVMLGPSGCGKTTTLNLVGGLDRPTGGELVVAGDEVARLSEKRLTEYRRRTVGFIFQFFNLIPTLSAAENVELSLTLTKARGARAEARRLLGLVGLSERADHFPSQLSGGEQQRVAIARALANRPAVLLCDEPTGNLDVEMGVQVLQVIRDLNKNEGATVILVTHNSAIAAAADSVIRLRNGRIEGLLKNDAPRPVSGLTW
jgi:putative ABC transport system ATP-binding protein